MTPKRRTALKAHRYATWSRPSLLRAAREREGRSSQQPLAAAGPAWLSMARPRVRNPGISVLADGGPDLLPTVASAKPLWSFSGSQAVEPLLAAAKARAQFRLRGQVPGFGPLKLEQGEKGTALANPSEPRRPCPLGWPYPGQRGIHGGLFQRSWPSSTPAALSTSSCCRIA